MGGPPCQGFSVVGLFAGIGGIEVGLHEAGHETSLLCEFDRAAQDVLTDKFDGVPLVGDVHELITLPKADLIAAGFPCQDLSQAGRTAGITGKNSGLVSEIFRLLKRSDAKWLLLENVPFMLQLDRGEAMRYLTSSLEAMGFSWAYRVVDARAFGIPQRRQRVIFLASRSEDPRAVIFPGDEGEPPTPADWESYACGFYWTEGSRGLGWAVDAIPTLKGGSTIGIASPPAIRFTDGSIGTPDIRDAERLQGFDADWTIAASEGRKKGARWKLVGNAVCVPVATWVGERLLDPRPYDDEADGPLGEIGSWPGAAWGRPGLAPQRAGVSAWPVRAPYQHLEDYLAHDAAPLSERATNGFLKRARASTLRMHPRFLDDVARHLESLRSGAVAA